MDNFQEDDILDQITRAQVPRVLTNKALIFPILPNPYVMCNNIIFHVIIYELI